jgi:hypothetical protein
MWAFSQNAVGAAELAAHVLLVRFERATADLEELGIAP